MGNTVSEEHDEFDKFDGIDTLGYRVLGVQPDSPASEAGLVSFLDFIVGANEQILMGSGEGLEEGDEYDDVDFPALCQEFLNKPLELLVWNIKCQRKRLVTIVPSNSWGGAGLLGVTIRLDDYGGADERLVRVLSTEPNSPAAIAGLVAEDDFLLGTSSINFDSTYVLAQVLQAHVDQVVELYVYNCKSNVVRVVALMPTYKWGGQGLLGAEVGTGYLHKLPASCRDTIGSSVERKVRWVGMKPKLTALEQQQQQNEANVQGQLEVEPQLEMEMTGEESPHHAHKTIQQVTSNSNGSNGAPPHPPIVQPQAHASEQATTEQPVETKSVQENGDKTQGDTTMPTTEASSETKPPMETTAAPVNNTQAASFFAAPPPPPAQSTYSSPMMPPPPFSHVSREQEVDLR